MAEPNSTDDSDRVIDLGDLERPDRESVKRRLDSFPPAERERMKGILESAEMKSRVEQLREVARHGPLAVVLLDRTLGAGVLAEVYLNASPPLSRFIVGAAATLDDELIDRATGLAFSYEMQHPGDKGEVRFTLLTDGSFVRESVTNGRVHEHQTFHGMYRKRDRRSKVLLQIAAGRPSVEIPHVGRAKVVSLGEL